jgi:hypothetical protein
MNPTFTGVVCLIFRLFLTGVTLLLMEGDPLAFAQESGHSHHTITSSEFQLIDPSGRQRAILGFRNGSPGLFLLGKDDSIRLNLLLLQDDSPGLLLNDSNGIVRAKIVDLTDDLPAVVLADQAGRNRLTLSLLQDGRAFVVVFDRDGLILAQLWITENGSPALDLFRTQAGSP